MKKLRLNLQYFAEGGGDGAGTSAAGAEGASEGQLVTEVSSQKSGRKSNPLANVQYGIQDNPQVDNVGDTFVSTKQAEDRATEFENMIRGDYKQEFDNRVQNIINKRFANAKETEAQMKTLKPMLDMLSQKYGTDPADYAGLSKAIQNDDSYYEKEALEKGLTVKQLKEWKQMERDNQALVQAQQEAQARQQSEQIYAGWQNEVEEFNNKYGMQIDFATEAENKDFCAILKNGGSVESAYKAIHFDEMVGGAMQFTAKTVQQKMVNSMQARAKRPSENGISSRASSVVKTDVHSLTREDRREIMRRAERGDLIQF